MSNKVLIHNSKVGIRESLKLVLASRFNLILTDSDSQCVDIINNDNDISLILLDSSLLSDDGNQVLQRIGNVGKLNKVLLVNDNKNFEFTVDLKEKGFIGCLNKPFKSDELLEIALNAA